MKRKSIILSSIFIVLVLSACSYEYHIKDEGIVRQQRVKFKQLCNSKNRSIIYETIQGGGYLSASRTTLSCQNGWDPIFKYGYQYAECTEDKIVSHILPADVNVYRFTLEEHGHPGCGTGEQHFIGYSRRNYHGNSPNYKETNRGDFYKKKHSEQLRGKCLVVKKVNKPMSRHMRLHEMGFIDEHEQMGWYEFHKKYSKGNQSKYKKGVISFSGHRILDVESGKVLAENWNYGFSPKGRLYSTSTSEGCSRERVYLSPADVIVTVSK